MAELEEVLEDLERRAVAQAQALERLPTELVRFEANIKALDTVRAKSLVHSRANASAT